MRKCIYSDAADEKQIKKTNQHRFFKGFVKTKGAICMEVRVVLNIYIPDNTVSKYLKQNLIRI